MDTSKVQLRRVTREKDELDDKGQPTGNRIVDPNSLVTAFSYIDEKHPDSTTTFIADAGQEEFAMSPSQAAAAVATGCFEVMESSKSLLEDNNPPE